MVFSKCWLWQIKEYLRGNDIVFLYFFIREKAEEIARIRSELKEKGLLIFMTLHTVLVGLWYIGILICYLLTHSPSFLLIWLHARSFAWSLVHSPTQLIILDCHWPASSFPCSLTDSVFCVSSHHQETPATILSFLVCHYIYMNVFLGTLL